MKRIALLSLLLLALMSLSAQQFYGCRTVDGWAETPMLRKLITLSESDISNGIISIEIYSFGYHEVYVNGVKVGDKVLQPAVSQLNKHLLSVTYELSPYLHEGENELLLWLGQGWGRVYGTPAAVSARVVHKYNAQWKKITETDTSWEASLSGYSYTGSWQPLQFGGERFDANKKPDWRPATRFKTTDVRVSIQEFEGNRILDTLSPVSIERQDDHLLLLDFGRVVTGWFQADFQPLSAGTEVTMEYLDHLQAVPPHTESDIYIARGSDRENFTNRFHAVHIHLMVTE